MTEVKRTKPTPFRAADSGCVRRGERPLDPVLGPGAWIMNR